MTTPPIPYRFELELEVPGTPDEVWRAIATAEGISAWLMPTDLDAREGGAVTFHMGPMADSHGQVTGFEPARRFAYEEDWASLVGHPDADVTPLATEFLVEAQSGGTCVVRVVTSAFGTGAGWEETFWREMSNGWAPMLDNLRLYLTHFAGARANTMWVSAECALAPDAAIAAVRRGLGIAGVAGERISSRGISGVIERSLDTHFVIRVEAPVDALFSFFAYRGADDSVTGVQLIGYLYDHRAAEYVDREHDAWLEWLATVTSGDTVDTSTA
jgi:uncharacterized protein YndB with AHSA1/START domain